MYCFGTYSGYSWLFDRSSQYGVNAWFASYSRICLEFVSQLKYLESTSAQSFSQLSVAESIEMLSICDVVQRLQRTHYYSSLWHHKAAMRASQNYGLQMMAKAWIDASVVNLFLCHWSLTLSGPMRRTPSMTPQCCFRRGLSTGVKPRFDLGLWDPGRPFSRLQLWSSMVIIPSCTMARSFAGPSGASVRKRSHE